MKILHSTVTPYWPALEGVSKDAQALTQRLAAKGHEVRALAYLAPKMHHGITRDEIVALLEKRGMLVKVGESAIVYKMKGVEVHAITDMDEIVDYTEELIFEFKPDACSVSVQEPSLVLLEAIEDACEGRTVAMIHTTSVLPWGPDVGYPGACESDEPLHRADAVLTVSKYLQGYVKKHGNVEASTIYVPSYGTERHRSFESIDNEYVTFFNPCDQKGLPIFLDVVKAMPDVKFAAVPTWGATEETKATLRAIPNVDLLEPEEDVDRIYARTRVVIHPSLWHEALSILQLESMLRGIPIVSSDVGGVPEAKLGTGYLIPVRPIEKYTGTYTASMVPIPEVPPQDAKPWVDALRKLLGDRTHYQEYSEHIREVSWEFVSSLTEEPLERALAGDRWGKDWTPGPTDQG